MKASAVEHTDLNSKHIETRGTFITLEFQSVTASVGYLQDIHNVFLLPSLMSLPAWHYVAHYAQESLTVNKKSLMSVKVVDIVVTHRKQLQTQTKRQKEKKRERMEHQLTQLTRVCEEDIMTQKAQYWHWRDNSNCNAARHTNMTWTLIELTVGKQILS